MEKFKFGMLTVRLRWHLYDDEHGLVFKVINVRLIYDRVRIQSRITSIKLDDAFINLN